MGITMSKHRILLVEDSKPAQQAAKHLLTDLQYSVDIAGHGKKALEQCHRVEYDHGAHGFKFIQVKMVLRLRN